MRTFCKQHLGTIMDPQFNIDFKFFTLMNVNFELFVFCLLDYFLLLFFMFSCACCGDPFNWFDICSQDIWNKTWYPKAADHVTTEKTWYVVDATDKILGRLASTIAIHIRGKNLATYTPSVDMGAFVIVVCSMIQSSHHSDLFSTW